MTNSDIFRSERKRQRAVNFVQLTDNIVESYPNGITHGIQKDALQNGWDAALKYSKSFIQTIGNLNLNCLKIQKV